MQEVTKSTVDRRKDHQILAKAFYDRGISFEIADRHFDASGRSLSILRKAYTDFENGNPNRIVAKEKFQARIQVRIDRAEAEQNALDKGHSTIPPPNGSSNGSAKDPSRRFSKSIIEAQFNKQGRQCARCRVVKRFSSEMEAHHLLPHCEGGTSHPDNCRMLCIECHQEQSEDDRIRRENPNCRVSPPNLLFSESPTTESPTTESPTTESPLMLIQEAVERLRNDGATEAIIVLGDSMAELVLKPTRLG